jgi:hypothetical protein
MIHGFFLMTGNLDAGKKCIDEAAGALRTAFRNPFGSDNCRAVTMHIGALEIKCYAPQATAEIEPF